MNVLIQFCFIHVVGGYVNVAQIITITQVGKDVLVKTPDHLFALNTGDKTPEDFLDRVKKTCGGKHD